MKRAHSRKAYPVRLRRYHVLAVTFLAGLVCGCAVPAHADFDPCRNMAAYTAQKVELTGADKEALLHSGFDMCRLGQEDGAKGDKASFADVIKIHQRKLDALIPGTREYIFEDWLFSFYSAGFTSSTPGKSDVDDLLGGLAKGKNK